MCNDRLEVGQEGGIVGGVVLNLRQSARVAANDCMSDRVRAEGLVERRAIGAAALIGQAAVWTVGTGGADVEGQG